MSPVSTSNKKVINWASIIEPDTLAQAERTASMPFIRPHLALMPDAHLGLGATVGSVIPTDGVVIPAAVGVDIGCGMDAVLTQWTKTDLEGKDLRALRLAIEDAIPLSKGGYNGALTESAARRVDTLDDMAAARGFDPNYYAGNWELQLGSLGSGNHFIEVSLDEQDRVWLFLHSGSRGVGNRIAQNHIKVAKKYCERHYIPLPDADLAYLVQGTREFNEYMLQLEWAQEFAKQNRAEMMDRVALAAMEFMGADVERLQEISCHHNYTSRERHFGKDLIVSRKGAIAAQVGVWGLIPGSMGDASYVVLGKGNAASLCSAPHGAGREYSRTRAKATFDLEGLQKRMEGVEWSGSDAFIDEHPSAYKPIDVIMRDAADLVEIRHTLRQIINVKGN